LVVPDGTTPNWERSRFCLEAQPSLDDGQIRWFLNSLLLIPVSQHRIGKETNSASHRIAVKFVGF
jgi:hypothetical protein